VVWHDSLLPGRDLIGLERLQALRDLLRGALPDLRLRLQQPLQLGEQGTVLGYWTAEGTHSGPLGPSLPPSGARASWEGSVLIRTQPQPQPQPQAPGDGDVEPGAAAAGDRAQGPPQGPGQDGQGQQATDGQGQAAAGPGAARRAVEVWWSWDPIFLFRQLGWQQGAVAESGPQAAAAGGAEARAVGGEAEAGAAPPDDSDARGDGGGGSGAAVSGGADGPSGHDDIAARTAAAARSAFASEAEAAEAAEAAAAAAESPGALAAAQAANRAVVELRGRAAMAAMMGGWRDCLPDLAIGHELFVAVGSSQVTFRWVIRGTHATPGSRLLGVACAGAPLLVKGVTTLTLRGGRIARKVSHANAAHTLQQLGAARYPDLPL
ncbi:hypothetical protein TSOC_004310, partial [Tetrabaena socialis]